ncbi:MAG: CYTH domain-containing protein [Pseudomonadota bacterium]
MAQEIELKFLVRDDSWRDSVSEEIHMRQGFLCDGFERSVRVRSENDKAFLNIKRSDDGIHRLEYEYQIPLREAQQLLEQVALQPLVEKVRYLVPAGDHEWEIDVFSGENQGLVIAEIELPSIDTDFDRPSWLGEEVSDDFRYYNVSLREMPYSKW